MTKPSFNFDTTFFCLPDSIYTKIAPTPISDPQMILFNDNLAKELHLPSPSPDYDYSLFLSGNDLPPGSTPFAQAYAGHQFGHFAWLGDGRAHTLGEHVVSENRFDIQLKGSGPTPYSRQGDGRAPLGPMLREYLISEAMYALGIPTTRSLAVVATGDLVFRSSGPLPGAVLTRVASSHIRVGSFEYACQKGIPLLQQLMDYTLARHFPHLLSEPNRALALLQRVIDQQIKLIVEWMRVGFVHGVMNTDNMTISGETIDYGPCAFLDVYSPYTSFSSIDIHHRYCFSNQPSILLWNLARFAETLLPLIAPDQTQAIELAQQCLTTIQPSFEQSWLKMMRLKLGLTQELPEDTSLVHDLLDWMYKNQADYTLTFIILSYPELNLECDCSLYQTPDFKNWFSLFQKRLECEPDHNHHRTLMQQANPLFIPRNHLVEQALNSAQQGDLSPLQYLLKALQKPYSWNLEFSSLIPPPAPHERVTATFCGT